MAFKKILVALFAVTTFVSCAYVQKRDAALFQVSTINALLEGEYEGMASFDEVMAKGDFGLGTFKDLDGEMVALEGKFYQVEHSGKVNRVSKDMSTPFVTVVKFKPDHYRGTLTSIDNIESLKEKIDTLLKRKGAIYAIRIDGEFSYLKARSVSKQSKPYPRLIDVLKTQNIFEFKNIQGTLVGFRLPDDMKGLNVPGYHFHFISDDRQSGGHLLDVTFRSASVQIGKFRSFRVDLPSGGRGGNGDSKSDSDKEIDAIESGK